MWRAKRAKVRAEEPAPWWQTKRGSLAGFEGGVMFLDSIPGQSSLSSGLGRVALLGPCRRWLRSSRMNFRLSLRLVVVEGVAVGRPWMCAGEKTWLVVLLFSL
jgi:hypothetical protein